MHLNTTSYFAGQLYGDTDKMKSDGTNHATGIVLSRLDRHDYWLIKVAGNSVYIMYKDKEFNE